ncbi:hypothetical protein PoB_001988600 [Plakobranchus ocellatus]|uniref:Uncharacterized protein n=1 Tax=Plakobranchus ocellatus TaxID=259542 RepID=A0AAV3Z235_9GAST|nr:hypothetical protein PoB_001988600 [Plakobranchus ocellatus]
MRDCRVRLFWLLFHLGRNKMAVSEATLRGLGLMLTVLLTEQFSDWEQKPPAWLTWQLNVLATAPLITP